MEYGTRDGYIPWESDGEASGDGEVLGDAAEREKGKMGRKLRGWPANAKGGQMAR